ncbi:hypothetical protein [Niabella ginsengisoli]|uniref:DUF481 domain-containing protein n=1 Tax=Niabella ginsengisoli TaxID=522298 RepID=A0ABS9SPN7_9BACT|nr:hypothetical protein [Niabella ginsengisoli]MCH5600340.1 hypothetical protein [Niabella ginsengisoli]
MKSHALNLTKPCNYLIGVVIFLVACANPRYINSPSVHNAAFLREQGDFKFSVAGAGNPAKIFSSISDDDESLDHSAGFDGQAAIAITNHFMLTASGMYRSEKDRYKDDDLSGVDRRTDVGYNRHMFDIGAGFYTRMGQSKGYFNGVAGVGFGKMSSTDNVDPADAARSRRYEANTLKYFLHPSFNFFFNDYLRMSVAPRFSLLKLNNIRTSYTAEEEAILGYNEARNNTFGLFEPSILLQTGFKNNDWLKLDLGFNFAADPFTTKSNGNDDNPTPDVDTYNVQSRNFLLSVGVSVYPMRKK